MKKRVILAIIAALCVCSGLEATGTQDYGDAILGVWEVAEKDAHIEFYKQGDRYFGKIAWLRKEPTQPDPSMFETPRVGLVIVRNFRFDGKTWKDGRLYDPTDGKSYRGIIALDDKGTLHVRGFLGIPLLGRTTIWQRVE